MQFVQQNCQQPINCPPLQQIQCPAVNGHPKNKHENADARRLPTAKKKPGQHQPGHAGNARSIDQGQAARHSGARAWPAARSAKWRAVRNGQIPATGHLLLPARYALPARQHGHNENISGLPRPFLFQVLAYPLPVSDITCLRGGRSRKTPVEAMSEEPRTSSKTVAPAGTRLPPTPP